MDMHIYYGYDHSKPPPETSSDAHKKSKMDQNSNKNLPKQVHDRVGVIGRNEIGFLLWEKDEMRTARCQLGSRLKTPTLPMWVTKVNGNYGILFNPNKELMRSYHAENRCVEQHTVLPWLEHPLRLVRPTE